METEHLALLISFLAFVSSIAIPLYLFSHDKKEKLEIEKKKFHQSALSVKSLIFSTKLEIIDFKNIEETKELREKLFEAFKNIENEIEELIKSSENPSCIKCYGGINSLYKCLSTIEAGFNDNLKLIAYIKEQSNNKIKRMENTGVIHE